MFGLDKIEFMLSAYKQDQFPDSPLPEIAFAGRSNVGKSSIINLLSRKGVARISKTPGRTQAVNFFRTPGLLVADLPGFGFAKVSKKLRKSWGELIASYLGNRENLKLIIWILDIRRKPDDSDRQMLEWLWHFEKPYLLVLNKSDKLARNIIMRDASRISKEMGGSSFVITSALKGTGKKELFAAISERL